MVVLVTGGSGFIGTNFISKLLEETSYKVINYDALTYAANVDTHLDIATNDRYQFVHGNILDQSLFASTLQKYKPNIVVHMAAESHVDRSITSSSDFIQTNITGTANILESTLSFWKKLTSVNSKKFKFIHVSTDEVFGDLGKSDALFSEGSCYKPSSPYSASKASSDMLVRAWQRTYKFPAIITNCSNNYGPYQNLEKLIPKIIHSALTNKPIPIYGDGLHQRDWIHVSDHASALMNIMENGTLGETYLIGGDSVINNLELSSYICKKLDQSAAIFMDNKFNSFTDLITLVEDRPGHDIRYAINNSKISKELSWRPLITFKKGMNDTIDWYQDIIIKGKVE